MADLGEPAPPGCPIYVVDTPSSAWSQGTVFGLGDPIEQALIAGRTLAAWRGPDASAPKAAVEGPAYVVGADTFANPAALSALAKRGDALGEPVRLARPPFAVGGLCDPFRRLATDDTGALLFDLWWVPRGQTLEVRDPERMAAVRTTDVDARVRTFSLTADLEVVGGPELSLSFSPPVCGPVGHWAELLRINLLVVGSQLMVGKRWAAVLRYLWAGLRAGSFKLERASTKLNRIAPGCRIHPSAVVELSVLEEGAEVGPGAVVRHSHLGRGASVGAQALAELSVLMEGASLQRQSMCVASAVYPGARVGATMQFGLVGAEATSKKYAVGTDMSLAGPVRTPTPDGLRSVDIGYLGVCFGHRSFVGSGVWIAAGRVVPEGAVLVRDAELMVRKPVEEALQRR